MIPSKEAIEEYWNCIALQGATADGVSKAIEAAYAIDVAPLEKEYEACVKDSQKWAGRLAESEDEVESLEQKVKELEAERDRLKEELDGRTRCVICGEWFFLGAEVHQCNEAQLEGK